MSQNCGECNWQDGIKPGDDNKRQFYCLFKKEWGPQYQDCHHFAPVADMNHEDRIAMALHARQSFETDLREQRQRQEAKEARREQRRFEWVKLIISYAVGIATGLALPWLTKVLHMR